MSGSGLERLTEERRERSEDEWSIPLAAAEGGRRGEDEEWGLARGCAR